MRQIPSLSSWPNWWTKWRSNYIKFRVMAKHYMREKYDRNFNAFLVIAMLTPTVTYGAMNSLFLYKYQQIVQMYKDGYPAEMDVNLENLVLEVWDAVDIPRRYKLYDAIKFFPVVGSEPFSAGALESRMGAIIGLPYNFTYTKLSDVSPSSIQFLGKHDPYMKWRSEAGQQLIASLVLSDDAKRFGIAREVHFTNNSRVLIVPTLIMISVYLGLSLGQFAIKRFKIREHLLLRLPIRMLSAFFGIYFYSIIMDSTIQTWEKYADEEAAKGGDNYLEGGIEYYNKLIQRNKALYHLLEDAGKSRFTEDGELTRVWWFRSKHVPFRERLDKLELIKLENAESGDKKIEERKHEENKSGD